MRLFGAVAAISCLMVASISFMPLAASPESTVTPPSFHAILLVKPDRRTYSLNDTIALSMTLYNCRDEDIVVSADSTPAQAFLVSILDASGCEVAVTPYCHYSYPCSYHRVYPAGACGYVGGERISAYGVSYGGILSDVPDARFPLPSGYYTIWVTHLDTMARGSATVWIGGPQAHEGAAAGNPVTGLVRI